MDLDDRAVSFLLASDEPGVRYLVRTDLLGEAASSSELSALRESILSGPKASAVLDFENVSPYQKWRGAHWRLVSLIELGASPGHPAVIDAVEQVLDHWVDQRRSHPAPVIDGLARQHASQDGNALAVAVRMGLASDPRAVYLAEALCAWQWPDGGWNCDPRGTRRSSFHESLAPTWGLIEYHAATEEPRAEEAARRAAELFLDHHLFRTSTSGEVIHPSFAAFHWPPYWHYDVLQALRVLAPLGVLGDSRADDAFDLLARKRLKLGYWRSGGRWWRPPGAASGNVEAVDWGRTANEMITLNALRAIAARRTR
jgi:hypothetical protein